MNSSSHWTPNFIQNGVRALTLLLGRNNEGIPPRVKKKVSLNGTTHIGLVIN